MQRFIAWFTLADPRAVAQTRIADLVAHKSGIPQADGIAVANFRTR